MLLLLLREFQNSLPSSSTSSISLIYRICLQEPAVQINTVNHNLLPLNRAEARLDLIYSLDDSQSPHLVIHYWLLLRSSSETNWIPDEQNTGSSDEIQYAGLPHCKSQDLQFLIQTNMAKIYSTSSIMDTSKFCWGFRTDFPVAAISPIFPWRHFFIFRNSDWEVLTKFVDAAYETFVS